MHHDRPVPLFTRQHVTINEGDGDLDGIRKQPVRSLFSDLITNG